MLQPFDPSTFAEHVIRQIDDVAPEPACSRCEDTGHYAIIGTVIAPTGELKLNNTRRWTEFKRCNCRAGRANA